MVLCYMVFIWYLYGIVSYCIYMVLCYMVWYNFGVLRAVVERHDGECHLMLVHEVPCEVWCGVVWNGAMFYHNVVCGSVSCS